MTIYIDVRAVCFVYEEVLIVKHDQKIVVTVLSFDLSIFIKSTSNILRLFLQFDEYLIRAFVTAIFCIEMS